MCDFVLEPTSEQAASLAKPIGIGNLDGLLAADFLGKQKYIHRWIVEWLNSEQGVDPNKIPLCVEETIRLFEEITAFYRVSIKRAIVQHNIEYLRKHYLWMEGVWHWTCVDFQNITHDVFDLLWEKAKVPAELIEFVCAGQDPYTWATVVQEYGPTVCLDIAIGQLTPPFVRICLDYGANVHAKDFVSKAMKNEDIFRMVTDCNPPATDSAWQKFKFRRSFGAIPNIPLVEQWFYTQGYKDT